MKKRILGLLLCLVMAVSLLPITAAAYDQMNITGARITGSGFEKGADGAYVLKNDSHIVYMGGGVDAGNDLSHYFTGRTLGLYQDAGVSMPVTDDPVDGGTYYLKYRITNDGDPDEKFTGLGNCLNASNCFLEIPGYTTAYVNSVIDNNVPAYVDITFQVTKIHEHQWQYTTTENSLTATCTSDCPIAPVSVTLTAHSVTLPDSPFNAQLKFEGDFKEVFSCSEIEYKYEDPGTGWEYVNPDTFTPKPGNYQAGVLVSGLPGNGGVAARSMSNADGAGQGGASVYLYVKYTAVDPKVTAQTGDNRPIEIMMAGVVIFSALAAAAFVFDNKRKYSR